MQISQVKYDFLNFGIWIKFLKCIQIEDVKNQIKEALNEQNQISTDCLAFRGKHLDDSSSLQDHGISDNDYLLYLYSVSNIILFIFVTFSKFSNFRRKEKLMKQMKL